MDAQVIEPIVGLIEKVGFPIATGMFGLWVWYRERLDAREMQAKLQAENKDLVKALMDLAAKQIEANIKNEAALLAVREAVRK